MPDRDSQTGESVSPTHVDRVAYDPLNGDKRKLLGRYPSADHPDIGAQERAGWATYVYVSEPHTMDDCPFATDALVLAIRQTVPRVTSAIDGWLVPARDWANIVRLAEEHDDTLE